MSQRPELKRIRITEVISLLKTGYTRWENEAYEANKSIQTHFGLSFSECKQLFKHEKIRGLKTKIPTMLIIDDTVEGTESVTEVSEEEETDPAPAIQQAPALVESALSGATPVEPTVAVPEQEENIFD